MAPDKPDKVKKRKRNTDDLSKPSKRVAIEEDKEIKISLREPENWTPVVVSSSGLALPTVALKPWTKARNAKGQLPRGQTPISRTELLLQSSAHPKLDYVAREEESDAVEPLQKHYVGVYDPKTGNLEVIESRKMVVRGTVRAHSAAAEAAESLAMLRDARNTLGETFGTKKSRKAIASFTENAITPEIAARMAGTAKPVKIDSVTRTMIDSIAESTAGMATRDQLAEASDAAKPRPKRNLDATEIREVYTIDTLVGEGIMKLVPVRQWMEALKANENVVTTSKFVSSRLARVSMDVEKLKILRYMYLLLEIYNKSKPARGAKSLPKREDMKAIAGDIPEAVLEDFRRKFTEGPWIRKFKSDLLITHLCALACLVDNFTVDIYDLQVDLKLDSKEMSQYFREIGAKIGALGEMERKRQKLEKAIAAQHKVAKLQLPLVFPQMAFARSRKK